MNNSIQQTARVLDLINKILVVTDTEQRICFINKTAEKYFTTSAQNACGKKYYDVIHYSNEAGIDGAVLFDDTGEAVETGRGILKVASDLEYAVQFSSEKITSDNNSKTYWFFIIEDITEKIELLHQVKHKRRMEVLGDFSSGIAQEINTNLGSILGSAEILSNELSGNTRYDAMFKTLIESVNSTAQLSKKIQKFAMPAGYALELVDVHEMLNEVLEVLSESSSDYCGIKKNYASNEIIVYADRAELEVVLMTLLLRTQENLGDDGELTIKTDVVDSAVKPLISNNNELISDRYLVVSIADNDGSIAENMQASESAQFSKYDKELGLSTLFSTLKELKGAIEIEAEAGAGSQCNLYLPLSDKAIEGIGSKEDSDSLSDLDMEYINGKKVVLLVDDNDLVRFSIREILYTMNCEVIEAENGRVAFELFKENQDKIDLVILDVIMPEKDGKETLVDIREIDQDIEIIMASGYMNQLSESVFTELGASGYLSKPFNMEELKKVIVKSSQENGNQINRRPDISDFDTMSLEIDDSAEFPDKEFEPIELMLFENNKNIRDVINIVLHEANIKVSSYCSIKEAKQALDSGAYHSIAIIDIDAAAAELKELFFQIRNNDDGLPRYIIVTSSKDMEHTALQAARLGADDIVLKPFSINHIKIRLEIARRFVEAEQTRIRIQSMLKESEERMALANNAVGIGMWDWKIDDKEFYASDKCKEIFGYVKGSNIGVLDYLYSVTIKDDQGVLTQQFSSYLREPAGILNIEFRIHHPEKGEIWILSIAKLFDDTKNGKPKRLIGISMDITERKQKENILREESQMLEEMVLQRTAELMKINEELSKEIDAREKAELKNMEQQLKLMDADKLASLGILVSGIGHEINNPIQFIMFNLPFIKNTWEAVLPILDEYYECHPDFQLRGVPYSLAKDRLPNMADDVIEGAERISSIVQELREYSRKSRIEDYRDEDIVEVVLSAKSLFMKFTGKSNINIGIHTPGEHIRVPVNRTRIEQVIINLLQNAALALEESVKKEININLSYSSDNNNIEISVSDTGIGIKQEHLKHLTDPFFTTRSSDGGTGLGLAMCKKIVHDHSGEMLFESEYGKGTTVKVLLPVIRYSDK